MSRRVLATVASGLIFAAVAVAPAALAVGTPTATTAVPQHVVLVGVPGLEWNDVTPGTALYRVAQSGSVGSLVEFTGLPLSCPVDGWLALNSGSRARLDHSESRPCPAIPAVESHTITGMAAIERFNDTLGYSPAWGALSSGLTCTVAAGPGAALALAEGNGQLQGDYLPSPADLTAADLARCPLTVIDLGSVPAGTGSAVPRAVAVRAADAALGRVVAQLPPDTTLVVVSPGAPLLDSHGALTKAQLGVAMISGTGYRAGLLHARSTRQPGLVVITDLTPTVRSLLGQPANGTVVTSGSRPSLDSVIAGFNARATAERVWTATHTWFFWIYAVTDAVALAAIGLLYLGSAEARRRRRAQLWRTAGVYAAAIPAGTFLAGLVPWARQAHPAVWLYGVSVGFAVLLGIAALAVGRQRQFRDDRVSPFGFICLFTTLVLGIDVATGSRLQLETPFGLSMLQAGRFYGIGNEALGIYGIAALGGAGWLALRLLAADQRRRALAAVAAVGVFAIVASGWPGFGGKAGGTITMVPCFLVLVYAVAGWRVTWRRVLLVAVSGLALLAVFGLANYLIPATGSSDIGSFAGGVVHGRHSSGDLLWRKIHANIGSLSVNEFSPLVPIVVVLTGLMLWRPWWFRLRLPSVAFAAAPYLGVLVRDMWLLALLGWFANDSGIIVPASAMPFALPLGIGMMAAASAGRPASPDTGGARYLDTARSSFVAGQTELDEVWL